MQTQELNLSFTRVVAPIAGRASYRRLAVGNHRDRGHDAAHDDRDPGSDPLRVRRAGVRALEVQARGRRRSRRARVDIRLQDETDYRWKGHVDFLDNSLDRSSGTIRLRAVVDNPDGFISPGMFGQMRLFAAKPFDTLLVPDQSIVTDQTRQVVYVVNADGIVGQKVVRPGRLMDGLRVIREGLDPRTASSSAAYSAHGRAARSR